MTPKRAIGSQIIATQATLFGGTAPPQHLHISDKVAHILECWEDTRADDRTLLVRFWEQFDGLRSLIGDEATDKLLSSASALTNPETIRRRRQEHQRLRTGRGHLLPDAQTIAHRRARDGAGPPGRR